MCDYVIDRSAATCYARDKQRPINELLNEHKLVGIVCYIL